MDLNQIARLLGGTVDGRWINIPGPGHRSKDRSLGVLFDRSAPDGFRIKSHADDPTAECRRYVKYLLARAECRIHEIEPPRQNTNPEVVGRVERALALWANASPAEESLVERYLDSRACAPTSVVKSADMLRFHPFCPFGPERIPAMLALLRHVITDQPTGIHRTALAHGGQGKRNLSGGSKRMWGRSAQAAVKLQPHNGVLGIAEGIETALSAGELFDVPVWALLSAGGIQSCPVIPDVRQLIIFADHDETGLSAAHHCARRYSGSGVEAAIRHPPTPKADFNDVQQEKRKCR
jgi:hypothetical protein